jgi:hypothetical protein
MTRFVVAISLLVPITLFSQTGSIRGQVTDARTGEPLVGANVIVVGSKPGHGAASDMNGMFLIHKIPQGEYVLRALYLGYQTMTIREVKVSTGQTTEANFPMQAEGESEPVTEKSSESAVVDEDTTNQPAAGTAKQ